MLYPKSHLTTLLRTATELGHLKRQLVLRSRAFSAAGLRQFACHVMRCL